jgi:peptidoglycan/LPS O-acetylase OafA/YrhL
MRVGQVAHKRQKDSCYNWNRMEQAGNMPVPKPNFAPLAALQAVFLPALDSTKRIPSLDGLRAISITFVLLAHLTGTQNFPAALGGAKYLGNLGVRVFFVISGFLITTLLLKEQAATGTVSLKKFYARRTLRIFPVYYCFLLVIVVLAAVDVISLMRHDLLCAFTYTMNNHYERSWYVGHLWSLSVEEQFYLLWPATLFLAGMKRAFKIVVAVLFIAPVCRILILFFLPQHWEGVGTIFPATMDSIAIGCLLARSYQWLGTKTRYTRFLQSPAFLLVPLAAAVLTFPISTKGSAFIGDSLLNLSIALIVDRFVRFPGGAVGKILNTGPFVVVGVLSYSLYLWQQLFLNRASGHAVNAFPVNIILVGLTAVLSYSLIEQPFLRLKTRFEAVKRPHTDPVTVAASAK